MGRRMGWAGRLAVLLALATAEAVKGTRKWYMQTEKCGEMAQRNWRPSCYTADVRPCTGSVHEGDDLVIACARTFYEDKPGAKPTIQAGTLKLYGCGEEGCKRGVSSLFDTRKILDQALDVLNSGCYQKGEYHPYYICAPTQDQGSMDFKHPVTGGAVHEEYAATTCVCSFDMCNQLPQLPISTRMWKSEYSTFFKNSSRYDAVMAIIKKMKQDSGSRKEEMELMSKSLHLPTDYSSPHSLNNTGAACPIKVSLEIANCFRKEERNADFLSVAMVRDIVEWQKTSSCDKAAWCWDLEGELLTNLSGVEYRLDFKFSACSNILDDQRAWALLAPQDVKELVIDPCIGMLPSQTSLSPQIDYPSRGSPLKVGREGINLIFRPSANLKFTCHRTQELPTTDQPTDLQELRRQLWIALIVWLVQVAIAGLLLPFAVFKTEKADDFIFDYRRTMASHLVPFFQYNAMPDNLVETFLELHCLAEEAEDYQTTRAMIHDHQRSSTYNFFGWRTGFDYRLFPCLGEPSAAPEENKCDCPECKHIPRINLTKLIRPARLIQMGLKHRALVDRKDPLYDTFLALHTDDCLPRDAKGSGTGDAVASGNLLSASPKLIDHRRRHSNDITQPESPPSDKSTLPTPTMSVHKATD